MDVNIGLDTWLGTQARLFTFPIRRTGQPQMIRSDITSKFV